MTQTAPPKYCPGRARHWRIAPGTIGLRMPVCFYCGSPNPKPLTTEEWRELIAWWAEIERRRTSRGWITEAIEAYIAELAETDPEEKQELIALIERMRQRLL